MYTITTCKLSDFQIFVMTMVRRQLNVAGSGDIVSIVRLYHVYLQNCLHIDRSIVWLRWARGKVNSLIIP